MPIQTQSKPRTPTDRLQSQYKTAKQSYRTSLMTSQVSQSTNNNPDIAAARYNQIVFSFK